MAAFNPNPQFNYGVITFRTRGPTTRPTSAPTVVTSRPTMAPTIPGQTGYVLELH